jgi:hypothetical protein
VEALIKALNAMVWERMALKLATGNTVSVGESRQEERVDTRLLLQNIEDFLGSFVQE